MQKPSHILVFDKEKGKATCSEMYGAKSQRLTQQIEISIISGTNPKWDVKIKRKEAKWKASKSNVIKFLWGVIYAPFYNWIDHST